MIDKNDLLDASCRVAFAAYMHDVGKLAQRANFIKDQEKIEIHKQHYCPRWDNRFTHWHAAYSVLALDLLEPYLPELVRGEMRPFEGHQQLSEKTDSLINAIGMHHKPETYLQWIVATADRASSGFERSTYDAYNRAQDSVNFKRERLLNIFEQVDLSESKSQVLERSAFKTRLPLKFFSPESIVPQPVETVEPKSNEAAENEYNELWQQFCKGLKEIPEKHRMNWALWLDHFDTLWMMVSHAIPSATSQYTGIRPDVSLYDHSKATAAFATAIWRYHEERGDDKNAVVKCLKERTGTYGWDEKKLLLIQGDFFGIQDFIFASGGETQKRAAKLLRGRSFYVSLLTEIAALKLLDALALPPTSVVLNAAGKFLIIAHNTQQARKAVQQVQIELDEWFLRNTYGQQGIGLATVEASCNQFVVDGTGENANTFRMLMRELFSTLEKKKLSRFNLVSQDADFPVRTHFLHDFDNDKGACAITGNLPASEKISNIFVSQLAADQITIGEQLAKSERNYIAIAVGNAPGKPLKLPIFGYQVTFCGDEAKAGAFSEFVKKGIVRRVLDVSPVTETGTWSGFARRFINASVPRFKGHESIWESGKYNLGNEMPDDSRIKSFEHIACENRLPIDEECKKWKGISAIGVLKGDVDNLGLIFQNGIRDLSFARMASLSRQLNNFFAVYLPWYCNQVPAYQNTYTVFAGGDDFFLIGPWFSQMKLVLDMRREFARFVCNDQITFSAALVNFKPGMPVRYLAEHGEAWLEAAKHEHPDKNRVACFGQILSWDALDAQLQIVDELEQEVRNNKEISTGFIYGLLQLVDMAEAAANGNVMANKWRAHLVYRIKRLLIDRNSSFKGCEQLAKDEALRLQARIGGAWIQKFRGQLRVALQTYLYLNRD